MEFESSNERNPRVAGRNPRVQPYLSSDLVSRPATMPWPGAAGVVTDMLDLYQTSL